MDPKVCPKLNILVTPWPGIALTCSTITNVFPETICFFIMLTN